MMSLLLFTCVFLNSVFWIVAQYKTTHIFEGRSGIVHLFEWKFEDIANECEFLGENQFGGVQVSPITEPKITDKYAWHERYQPVSYKINSRSGTVDQFEEMIKTCLSHNIRVYVDVVINHMAAGDAEIIGTANSIADPPKLQYPAVPYQSEEFNEFCNIQNYSNVFEIRNCRLVGLPDLNQGKESVQDKIVEFLNSVIDMGVAGFRIDAVKHMWPMDLANIYKKLNNLSVDFNFPEGARPFIYQEVIDLGGEAISKTEYSGMGAVTEFMHAREIGLFFNGKKPLHDLLQWGPAKGFLKSDDAIIFVSNHDNQRQNVDDIITFKDRRRYIMATAFMLAHPYGIPRLMSSYEFEDFDQGPPADAKHDILSPSFTDDGQCVSPWICEHRFPPIVEMIKFRNVVGNSTIGNWADNGQNQMAFCRGNLGFIAFNNELSLNFMSLLQTCVPQGIYCDVISGGKDKDECVGTEVIVDENGKAMITIPYESEIPVVAFHIESKL